MPRVFAPRGFLSAGPPTHATLRELDAVLLGLRLPKSRVRSYRSGPVKAVRPLGHGHEPVDAGKLTAIRANLDTGPGMRRLNRLSLLMARAPVLRSWMFDVDDGRWPHVSNPQDSNRALLHGDSALFYSPEAVDTCNSSDTE